MLFYWKKFLQETRDALFMPRRFFQSLAHAGRWTESLPKVLVYGFLAGLVILLWSLLNLGSLEKTAINFGLAAVIGMPALCAALFPLASFLLYVLAMLLGGKKSFGAAARGVAAITVILPVNFMFGLVSGLSIYAGLAGMILIWVWVLTLVYLALTRGFQVKKRRALPVCGTLIIITLVLGLISLRELGRSEKLPPEVKETIIRLEEGQIRQEDVRKVQEALREALNKKTR